MAEAAILGTLQTALTSGQTYTSLSVTNTTGPVETNETLTIGYESGTTQAVTVSAPAPAGSTLITVNSFAASSTFPRGTFIGSPGAIVSVTQGAGVPGTANTANFAPNNADAVAVDTTNLDQKVDAFGYAYNGTTWDRVRATGTIGAMDVNQKSAAIAVPTDQQAIYRVQNTRTVAALAGSAAYTSAGADALNYRRWTGIYTVTGAAASGTLNLQESSDNANWYTVNTPIAVAAASSGFFDVAIHARYVRMNYVNGAAAQTTFELTDHLSAA